jgi:hypothetical protein
MHIEGPWLSTTGKRKGKKKFASAEHARKARELDESWKDMQKRWGIEAEQKRKDRALKAEPLSYSLSAPQGRDTGPKIPSRDTGHMGAVRTKDIPKYTGTLIKGIATMHKSNAVPVLNQEQAEEISKMRR